MRPLIHVQGGPTNSNSKPSPPRPYIPRIFSIPNKPVPAIQSYSQSPFQVPEIHHQKQEYLAAMAQTTTTTPATTVPHPPAIKVGGRRLSISAKPKNPHHAGTANTEPSKEDTPVEDYPRPAPPTNEAPLHHNHQHNNNNEEEVPPPKKEKIDKKMQELAHKKAETTRPTRDINSGNKGHAMGIRISQPAGKGLGL